MAGSFAPWANVAPVMTASGGFDLLPISRFEELRAQGKIVKTKTGLDAYAAGFDPKAIESAQEEDEKEGSWGFWPF